jgi:hypothetical protein
MVHSTSSSVLFLTYHHQGITTTLGLCIQADPQRTAYSRIDLHCPIWGCLHYHAVGYALQVSSNYYYYFILKFDLGSAISGFILFAIILGGGVGHYVFARDTVSVP